MKYQHLSQEVKAMKGLISLLTVTFLLVCVSESTFSDDLFIYPEKGQSKEQMEKDKYECCQWAKSETGFDPMAAPKVTEPQSQAEAPKGGVVKGAAKGALVGVAVGAIAGDAGKGAAMGAAAGGVGGGLKKRSQKKQQEQERQKSAQEQAADYQKNRDLYNRAYSVCLEGKGYKVK